MARPNGIETLRQPPAEWENVANTLKRESTVVWQLPNNSERLYTLLNPPGRGTGLLWAERTTPWQDVDRNYLKLSARLIERSQQLKSKIGSKLEPNRLQQRLDDASIIAGRMAHDFDNILTGIIGFADLALPQLPPTSQAANFVLEIAKVGQRGITFTKQLHQLSRSGQAKPQPGNIATAFACEELRHRNAMPSGLKVKVEVPEDLPAVAMDTPVLQTVLGHILENGVAACSGQSEIRISAGLVSLTTTDADAYQGRVCPGSHIEVTVHDTGSGIKPDVRAKLIAEPFFTTKVGHRGLGLAIVHRILHAHQGGVRIDAATPPESGTVVRVVIPLAAVCPAVAPTPAAHGSPFTGG